MRPPKRTTARGYHGSSPLLRHLARDDDALKDCQTFMGLWFAGNLLKDITACKDAGELFKITHSIFQRGIQPVAALPLKDVDNFFATTVEMFGVETVITNVKKVLNGTMTIDAWETLAKDKAN